MDWPMRGAQGDVNLIANVTARGDNFDWLTKSADLGVRLWSWGQGIDEVVSFI